MKTKRRKALRLQGAGKTVVLFALLGALSGSGAVGSVRVAVSLTGTPAPTAVSGVQGSPFTVGNANSSTNAVWGLTSNERSDEPCLTTVSTEDVMDSGKDGSAKKDLCGKKATSSDLSVSYPDYGANGARAFVTGIRVCMNNDRTRVKGFGLRGKKIDDGGNLVDLTQDPSSPTPGGGGEHSYSTVTEPTDKRTNCDDKAGWMRWVECPAGQVATAVVAHYEGGDTPRSLTGVALQCRSVTKTVAPIAGQVPKARARKKRPAVS